MNASNQVQIRKLSDSIVNGTTPVIFGEWPSDYGNICQNALDLKRAHQYDDSLAAYIYVIRASGKMMTEVGRSMAKTLCAMNDFVDSILFFYFSANAKWEATVCAPAELYGINPEFAKSLEQSMPTAAAANFFDIRSCIKQAANGNVDPLIDLAKGMSGNEATYRLIKNRYEIINESQEIVQCLTSLFE